MKKIILLIASSISLTACGNDEVANGMQYEFPECGISQLNGKNIKKVCATQDSIAKKVSKDYTPKFLQILVGAGHTSSYSGGRSGLILDFENQELDLQGHVWDFSKQKNPELVIRGHDSSIKNGIFLRSYLTLGSNEYLPPQFLNGRTFEENTSYAKFLTSGASIQNFNVINIKGDHKGISLNSWGAKIINCFFIINENMNLQGSKATIIHNNFFSDSRIPSEKKKFILKIDNQSKFLNKSEQIFPDRSYDHTAIPNALYVKFSPDTIIDGNTFTLTQKNDQAYAIVLDHSPRVRITNNTFNGFKVPILMDQWSSIVDEKGKEMKPEQFTGYGNIINPNKFAGHVTMNRKGEIVKE
ncbi:hypothetical protein [Acinetobacter pittii]|uniref:hypothetical protein n=1 Tax=Acinetobacter pittii TaxID=48296 RepID=UPI00197CCD67|nr:hypothetical protein [Acinetobacter pittii]MBN6539561.1 hypothetical protein [Acinetobacter pittii]